MTWATFEDVRDRWVGSNLPTDADLVTALINDAEAVVLAEYPLIQDRIDAATLPLNLVKMVVVRMVSRVLRIFVTGPSTLEAIVKAYKAAGSWDGDKLAAEFLKFDNTEFLVGPTKFSNDLHINVERPMRIMQVQDGQYSFLKELTPQKVVFAG
jgi:hypothetical protein